MKKKAQEYDFLEAKELGTTVPKRCSRCIGCNDCSLRAVEMTNHQQEELRLIESSMVLDADRKMIVAEYPIIKDPNVLTNNRKQAISI